MNIFKKVGAIVLSAALVLSLGLSAVPITAHAAYESSGTGENTIRVHFTPGGNLFSTDLTR